MMSIWRLRGITLRNFFVGDSLRNLEDIGGGLSAACRRLIGGMAAACRRLVGGLSAAYPSREEKRTSKSEALISSITPHSTTQVEAQVTLFG